MKVQNRSRKRKGGKVHKNSSPSSSTPTGDGHSKLSGVNQSSASKNAISKTKKASSFLDKMKARLSGGHFRMLNEKLYTCSGDEALNYFKENPDLFNVYHAGYQEQMLHWPEQPVNIITKWLKDHSPSLVVADFGCGDGRLARSVKNKVWSLDLVANDPSVIACDMSNTPLLSLSVDVAVFCLSLMGTDYPSYIQEARRVLKPRGWLLIAEVKSRLDPNTGGADPNKFLKAICELGFTIESKDFSNKMFALFYLKKKEKQNSVDKEISWPELKPCIYKRR
ncbi:ribosomal RNA-processing protein 8 [Nicotiana tabacum]|uniref:Ribosomal RNA-processing protein 8 n=2 Tax=Nicotiana TaxID=4085 RepID=A0A1S4AAF3_TOBAC|nr:PREDICTED: ribosomal RNA-processing protein 8 [Nicotiana sylvestris]XP_016473556.1 PREDICTED: ribosomal RNA-processing protein 8-like [Nicotiana tabacum]